VLSETTHRIDEHVKVDEYKGITSLDDRRPNLT